tara:strand:+ start:433 stop:837 length:405 start_codon:yes stop_codon:yes gene_type:complete
MAICRIWYRADEIVFITHYQYQMKPPGQTDQEFRDAENAKILLKNPAKYGALDTDDVDDSTLPDCCFGGTPDRLRGLREKLRGTKAAGLRVDNSIRNRQDIVYEIDTELDKPSPDMKKVAKLERKLRKRDYSPL